MEMIEEDMPEWLKQLRIWNLHMLRDIADEIDQQQLANLRTVMAAAAEEEASHANQSQRENPVWEFTRVSTDDLY